MDKIEELKFWKIIENSKTQGEGFEDRIQSMINQLAGLTEEEILNFEKVFRTVLSASSDYGLMAALYVMDGSVSDDSFLYFRCRLIAEGKKIYFESIKSPDILAEIDIPDFHMGEEMLYLADKAFVKKFGEYNDKELPRDVFVEYLDYNFESNITGSEWTDDDLPVLIPKLVKMYS